MLSMTCFNYIAIETIRDFTLKSDKWVFGLTATPVNVYKINQFNSLINEVQFNKASRAYPAFHYLKYHPSRCFKLQKCLDFVYLLVIFSTTVYKCIFLRCLFWQLCSATQKVCINIILTPLGGAYDYIIKCTLGGGQFIIIHKNYRPGNEEFLRWWCKKLRKCINIIRDKKNVNIIQKIIIKWAGDKKKSPCNIEGGDKIYHTFL